MSNYRDPYGTHQYGNHTQQDFNPYPYTDNPQQYPTYDQGNLAGGYDARNAQANQFSPTEEKPLGYQPQEPQQFEEFTNAPKEKTAASVKKLRADDNSQMWTQGGRGRCIGRFCCCTLWIFLFLLVSVVLALALWVNPPNVEIGDVRVASSGGSQFQVTTDGVLKINLELPIRVDNPNYFQVAFKTIKADLTYPINNIPIGGGESQDVVFKANTKNQNWTFPFAIEYKQSEDPGSKVFADLTTKCAAKQNLNVKYKITLGLRILFVTIHPTISNSVSFACPIDPSELGRLFGGSGSS